MTKIAGQVEENLQYYSYLDPISRRLNAPNAGAIVGSREFSEMLATIDHCLKYMKAHVGLAIFVSSSTDPSLVKSSRGRDVSSSICNSHDQGIDSDSKSFCHFLEKRISRCIKTDYRSPVE
jgi:hypothetical protein